MEVHHHPALHHQPKRWKEYLLEFTMIFLAVTMGFFAENIRESIRNNEKEKHYIKSLEEDIKSDIAQLHNYINFKTNVLGYCDSRFAVVFTYRIRYIPITDQLHVTIFQLLNGTVSGVITNISCRFFTISIVSKFQQLLET